MKHIHHIIPKHIGGTDCKSNLIELTIEEHAKAHRKLYEQHGKWQDKLAWQGLAGMITHEEVIKIKLSEAGKMGAKVSNEKQGSKRPNRNWSQSEEMKAAMVGNQYGAKEYLFESPTGNKVKVIGL